MNIFKKQGVWDDFKKVGKAQSDDAAHELARELMEEGYSAAQIIDAVKEEKVESSGVDSVQRTEQDQEKQSKPDEYDTLQQCKVCGVPVEADEVRHYSVMCEECATAERSDFTNS